MGLRQQVASPDRVRVPRAQRMRDCSLLGRMHHGTEHRPPLRTARSADAYEGGWFVNPVDQSTVESAGAIQSSTRMKPRVSGVWHAKMPLQGQAHPQLAKEPPRVSVVIPTLNEAKNLEHVLPELPDGLFEVVLVDGGSTDATIETARRLHPAVHVVSNLNAPRDGLRVLRTIIDEKRRARRLRKTQRRRQTKAASGGESNAPHQSGVLHG